jgi:hypothetical protein
VGFGLFIALILAKINWIVIPLRLSGFQYYTQSFFFLISVILLDIIFCVLFLFLSHNIKIHWVLVLVWGLVGMVISAVRRALHFFVFYRMENIGLTDILNPGFLISGFIMDALFMTGIIIAIRYWGTKVWSIAAGTTCAYVISYIVWSIISLIMLGHRFDLKIQTFIINTINYAIFGAAIYYGLYFHFKNKVLIESRIEKF